jgi:cytoskeletal protein CcmA (bactofilin family)
MFSKNQSKAQNRIDTLIGAETKIEGDIHFSGGLRIDGNVIGNVSESVTSPSTLVLSESARIIGAVSVSHIVVNGKIDGAVRANEYIELQTKSRVIGDVYYKSLEMHTGAVIEGKLIYLGESPQGKIEDKRSLLPVDID